MYDHSYQVLSHHRIEELVRIVNEKLATGYKLAGGVSSLEKMAYPYTCKRCTKTLVFSLILLQLIAMGVPHQLIR